MSKPFYAVVTLVAGASIALAMAYALVGFGSASATPTPRPVTDVEYGPDYQTRTELCVKPDGGVARDWKFADRWMKNQLSYDTYTVDGRVYNALRIVTNDPKLPRGHVRFRKVVINIGDGPTLEGHSYLNTRINGQKATIERELLFVEFNGKLEHQRRPLPLCGTPRS